VSQSSSAGAPASRPNLDSYGVRRIAAAYTRRFHRKPNRDERYRIALILEGATATRRTPVKWVIGQIERAQAGDVLAHLEAIVARGAKARAESNAGDALRHRGFSPAAYLVRWDPPPNESDDKILIRYVPVVPHGTRVLLGSGDYLTPDRDARFALPEDVSEPSDDPTQTLTRGVDTVPGTLMTFAEVLRHVAQQTGQAEGANTSGTQASTAAQSGPSLEGEATEDPDRELDEVPPPHPPKVWLVGWNRASARDLDPRRAELLQGALRDLRGKAGNYAACLQLFSEARDIGLPRLALDAVKAIRPSADADWGVSEIFSSTSRWGMVDHRFALWATDRLSRAERDQSWYRANAIGWLGSYWLMSYQPALAWEVWSIPTGQPDATREAIAKSFVRMIEVGVDAGYVLDVAESLDLAHLAATVRVAASRSLAVTHPEWDEQAWSFSTSPDDLVISTDWFQYLMPTLEAIREDQSLVFTDYVDDEPRVSVKLADKHWWYHDEARLDEGWPLLLSRERGDDGTWLTSVAEDCRPVPEADGRFYWVFRGRVYSNPFWVPTAIVKWSLYWRRRLAPSRPENAVAIGVLARMSAAIQRDAERALAEAEERDAQVIDTW
jgi:hypothetical protein